MGDHEDIEVLRPGDDSLADPSPEEATPARPPALAHHHLRGVEAAGEGEDRLGGVLGHDQVVRSSELFGEDTQPGELVRPGGGTLLAGDVDGVQLPTCSA
jgi:hypothetical protein